MGDDRPPADPDKVMDEGLDVLHGVGLQRRRGQRVIGLVGPFRHVVETLPNDPKALAHLFDPHQRPGVTISGVGGRNIEIEVLVTSIGALFSEIPLETAGPQIRSRDPPLDGLVAGVGAHPLGARFEDPVLHHHVVVLVEPSRQIVEEIGHQALPPMWEIVGDAADPEPARVHASTANGFDDVEDPFAIHEHEEDR